MIIAQASEERAPPWVRTHNKIFLFQVCRARATNLKKERRLRVSTPGRRSACPGLLSFVQAGALWLGILWLILSNQAPTSLKCSLSHGCLVGQQLLVVHFQ